MVYKTKRHQLIGVNAYDSLRVVLDVLWSLLCNQRPKLALHMHPLQAPLDMHPRHSPSALTLFIMVLVLVLVLYFNCTFNESTARILHIVLIRSRSRSNSRDSGVRAAA